MPFREITQITQKAELSCLLSLLCRSSLARREGRFELLDGLNDGTRNISKTRRNAVVGAVTNGEPRIKGKFSINIPGRELDELASQHTLRRGWVVGHGDHNLHNRCDALAVAAGKKRFSDPGMETNRIALACALILVSTGDGRSLGQRPETLGELFADRRRWACRKKSCK